MWLLNFLPDWIIYAALAISVAGFCIGVFLKFIPFVGKYSLPIKLISGLLTILFLWLAGGIANQKMWEDRVKEMEAKIKQSEAKSKKANLKLIENVNKKTNQVKEANKKLKLQIKQIENKIDAQCVVDPEALKILNEAAKGVAK